jgi:exodeoxyribonuclease V alpha subunit
MVFEEGRVIDIIFKNEENGYTVAEVEDNKDIFTIVGVIPYINIGINLKLQGEWVIHPQFGQQFKVDFSEEIMPDTAAGIEKYLSSGFIKGIGPSTAKKIVDKFGVETFQVLDNNIERLMEIEGIGEKKIGIIYESYMKEREIKNIMIFLQTYGITPNQCLKIYKRFGKDAITKLKDNPYILTEEISGIGFKTADKIARNLNIEPTSPYRIKSGINYIINQFCGVGNTYIPLEILTEESKNLLEVDAQHIEENIYESVIGGKLKIEEIQGRNCAYTPYFYNAEVYTAGKLLSLSLNIPGKITIDIPAEIKEYEKINSIEFSPSQIEGIMGAVSNNLEVITGGPGTGKTTIINCICYIFDKIGRKISLAAPTGRAAKRMSEATGREAKTIHRLLEIGQIDDENVDFKKGEEEPLDCDVLILDEASMIDIVLMYNLLSAVSLSTRLIIVGDVDQLPSVGPGNVLSDIINSGAVKVVKLRDIYRQAKESMIIVNAHRINNGEMPFLNEKDKDFYFIRTNNKDSISDTIISLINERLPKFNKGWDKVKDIQILTPMRKGPLGVNALNKKLQEILNPPSNNKKEKPYRTIIFREGDKVMQIKNNYSLKWERIKGTGDKEGSGIFNGDVGYIEKIDEDNDIMSIIYDDDKRVDYDSLYLDELEHAYAITIHKSQGSEFKVVIMPSFMGPPLLMNRNLLYTGVTRAKKLVVVVGEAKGIGFMISNKKAQERYSALSYRIVNIMDK